MIKMLQLSFYNFFMIKISCLHEKKTVSDKPWKNMLHDKTIPPLQNLRYDLKG